VLVLDDSDSDREAVANGIAAHFREQNIAVEVVQASSCLDGIAESILRPIDAVFVDYNFPGGMNGEEFLKAIGHRLCGAPIVLMSAHDEQEVMQVIKRGKGLFSQGFTFMRKPFDRTQMLTANMHVENYWKSRPLPHPIHTALAGIERASNSMGQLVALKDVIEATAQYLVVLTLADLLQSHVSLDGLGIRWENIGLGGWMHILSLLVEAYPADSDVVFAPEVLELVGRGRKRASTYRQMLRFKDHCRNDILGHGTVMDDGAYSRLFETYYKDLAPALGKLAALGRYLLVAVQDFDFDESLDDAVRYRGFSLLGPTSPYARVTWTTSQRLRRGTVCVRNFRDEWRALSPFYVLRTCPECLSDKLFAFTSVKSTLTTYRAPCNHSITVEDDGVGRLLSV
jgi:hypothetical protein